MKKHLLVVGIIFLFVGMGFQPAYANDNNISIGKTEQQPFNGTFMKTFGGGYDDSGKSVQQTSDGGYIITGIKDYYYSMVITGDVWLIKTDSYGNVVWDKTFGEGEDFDGGECVQQTSDGGYIITGFRHSSTGEKNIFLIKTDNDGNLVWYETFIGRIGYYVQQTTDGGYILTGDGWYSDVLLIKTDSKGNIEWDKVFEGNGWEGGKCVQQTTDGGYILTGIIGDDLLLIKTDSAGNKEWDKTFGGIIEFDTGYYVQQTTDGGYIITGKGSGGFISYDVWLIKTDSSGNIMWDKSFGARIFDDIGYCVQQTTDGGYIITGETFSFRTRSIDVLLIKTDEFGRSRDKSVTVNMLLLRILERFPLLWRVVSRLNVR